MRIRVDERPVVPKLHRWIKIYRWQTWYDYGEPLYWHGLICTIVDMRPCDMEIAVAPLDPSDVEAWQEAMARHDAMWPDVDWSPRG